MNIIEPPSKPIYHETLICKNLFKFSNEECIAIKLRNLKYHTDMIKRHLSNLNEPWFFKKKYYATINKWLKIISDNEHEIILLENPDIKEEIDLI